MEWQRRPVGSCSRNGIRPTERFARMCASMWVMDGRKKTRSNQRNLERLMVEQHLHEDLIWYVWLIIRNTRISKCCIIYEIILHHILCFILSCYKWQWIRLLCISVQLHFITQKEREGIRDTFFVVRTERFGMILYNDQLNTQVF
jgi:hypothetical protein